MVKIRTLLLFMPQRHDTALFHACRLGQIDIIAKLVEYGSDVEYQNEVPLLPCMRIKLLCSIIAVLVTSAWGLLHYARMQVRATRDCEVFG
jgi:ankyrin repeat protein